MTVTRVVVAFDGGAELALRSTADGLVLEGAPESREGWKALRTVLDLVLDDPAPAPAPAARPGPPNRGRAWSAEEDARLLARFDADGEVAALARELGRTRGAVRARLAKHGRLPAEGLRWPVTP